MSGGGTAETGKIAPLLVGRLQPQISNEPKAERRLDSTLLKKQTMAAPDVREDPFPARRRETSGIVNGTATDIARVDFGDRILVTISQGGRLSHWVR